jgi:hypothetical protein
MFFNLTRPEFTDRAPRRIPWLWNYGDLFDRDRDSQNYIYNNVMHIELNNCRHLNYL